MRKKILEDVRVSAIIECLDLILSDDEGLDPQIKSIFLEMITICNCADLDRAGLLDHAVTIYQLAARRLEDRGFIANAVAARSIASELGGG